MVVLVFTFIYELFTFNRVNLALLAGGAGFGSSSCGLSKHEVFNVERAPKLVAPLHRETNHRTYSVAP